jgi:hypothetical protein
MAGVNSISATETSAAPLPKLFGMNDDVLTSSLEAANLTMGNSSAPTASRAITNALCRMVPSPSSC